MIKLNPRKTVEYVLESERNIPKEEQTVFEIATLTVEQESIVKDAIFVNGKASPYNQYAVAFKMGVRNVRNLVDANDEKIEYKNSDEIISAIPRSDRDEVGLFVLRSIERSKEETKN